MLPREKILQLGVQSLTESELLSVLLGSGSAKENVFELSHRIVTQPDFQKALLEQQTEYWTKVPGIGPTKATRLVAGVELTKRMIFKKDDIRKITHAKDVFELFRPLVVGKQHESFYVICLNTKNEILLTKEIHRGFCNQVITDMKVLFSTILQTGALSFICVHNHPSGECDPSEEDQELTRKISAAAMVLDLNFLDHVIVSTNEYYGFSDRQPDLLKYR
jgi:DNA repair protein RadC